MSHVLILPKKIEATGVLKPKVEAETSYKVLRKKLLAIEMDYCRSPAGISRRLERARNKKIRKKMNVAQKNVLRRWMKRNLDGKAT